MKRLTLITVGISLAFAVSAQKAAQQPIEIHNANGSVYKKCFYVKSTKPLTELIKERNANKKAQTAGYAHPAADADAMENFAPQQNNNNRQQTSTNDTDMARQYTNGVHRSEAPIIDIDGQASATGSYPMDPNGMVSTLYYVQTVNSSLEIWNKNGSVKLGQTDLKNGLFGTYGDGDCGDPVVMYDKVADRWIITEFEGCENNFNSNDIDTLLMAVSQTNDPTGSYWLYAFDPNVSSYDDYPKYHVWGNGYYMTCNCTPNMVVAYQRDSMLVGGNAGMIVMNWSYPNPCTGNFFCPMMLDCDGTLPSFNSPEYLFYFWDNSWGCGGGADSICIQQVNVNWSSQTGSVSAYQDLITSPFNSNFKGGFDQNIPQPGNNTANYLASNDGFFGYRIPYLRWSSYNSCVMTNPVNVGTFNSPVSGQRWYELRQDTTTKLWSIYQQSTWAPADGVSRWEGSIAMNLNGDIGLAYSVSDKNSTYPGLRYTGRKYCDTINKMTLAEVNVISGNVLINTPQNTGNRWGDYSLMSIDPSDGVTFWYTNMYAKSGASFGSNMQTRIFSFKVPSCVLSVNSPEEPSAKLTAYQNGGTLMVKGTDVKIGERLVIELFDESGRRIMQQEITPTNSNLVTSFNISSLAKAMYIVRLGNDSYQRVVKVMLTN